ncbi:Conidial development protein fluffy [Paramyrothecium foliicola]|nr:Conidial development protein fluffy [Paramyrothecium foliicola]
MVRNNKIEKLRMDNRHYEAILQRLRDAPEEEALSIIRRLKSTTDISAVLASSSGAVSPTRPSELDTTRNTIPPTFSNIEFELTMLHGVAYPALAPLDVTSIDMDDLVGHSSGSLGNLRLQISSTSLLPSQTYPNSNDIIDPALLIPGEPAPLRGMPEGRQAPLSGPLPPPKLCDTRLNQLKLEYWTKVPINDEFAAHTISTYLEYEHTPWGFFDADLFLRDLVEHRLEYCSSFLFKQYYVKIDSRAASLSLAFRSEALKLWQAQRALESITTVAAMSVLSLAVHSQGMEQQSLLILEDMHRIASRMRLFGTPHAVETIEHFRKMSPDLIRATAHVAWGSYCWLRWCNVRLRSFTSADATPQAIFKASLRQLQRLIVEYVSRERPELYSPLFNTAVLHVSNVVLRNTEDPSWRFYYLLCMAYWKEVYARHPVMGKIVQASLSVAMSRGSLTSTEAQSLMVELQQRARHQELGKLALTCIIDYDRAISGQSGSRAHELAQKFTELTMFEDLTTGEFTEEQDRGKDRGQDVEQDGELTEEDDASEQ